MGIIMKDGTKGVRTSQLKESTMEIVIKEAHRYRRSEGGRPRNVVV